MTDLALEEQMSGTIRLYDIDAQAAKNNEIIGNRLKERPDVKGKWEYVTSSGLEDALTGVDFVVISILPGTFDEMEDVHVFWYKGNISMPRNLEDWTLLVSEFTRHCINR